MAGPKPFNDTLVQLRYGELHSELTDAVNEVVTKVATTQKSGKITLTLAFKSGKGGQIEIADELKLVLPKEEKGSTIMFATVEGNLQREDPRQKTFEGIRSVEQEMQARKDTNAAAPLQPRAAAGGA